MKNEAIGTVLKLIMCPGVYNHDTPADICKVCQHRGKTNCHSHLRAEGMDMVQKCQEQSTAVYTGDVELEIRVTKVLHELGVPAHIRGHNYLRDAIMLTVSDPSLLNVVTKELYPAVAKQHGSSSSKVERAIRHAIEVAWCRGNIEAIHRFFGFTVNDNKGKPTNSECIAMIADKLRLGIE